MQGKRDSLVRLSVVVALLVAGIVGLRLFILPASLTDVAMHQRDAAVREAKKPLQYAGAAACADCHTDQPQTLAAGYHATLACETCHGAAQAHLEDFEVKPVAPRQRDFCPVCHTYDPSRPTGFPQINSVAHNPLKPCIECHNPHDPRPPVAPRECEACHAEIARTKAVSHHVRLDCTTCHTTPEGHRTAPRAVRPSKPSGRDFCGKCHGQDSTVSETLKVDLATHGGRYLCWQCHYPHLPEAG